MFGAYPVYLQNVHFVIVYMQPLVSSLSAGDCLVHQLRKNFFLNWCTESDDTSYEVDLLKMSSVCSKHVEDFN
jgi:hypothetical protein